MRFLFFLYFLIDLCFLIPEVIAHIFISIAELVIPTGAQTIEKNAEIKTVIAEDRMSKFSA